MKDSGPSQGCIAPHIIEHFELEELQHCDIYFAAGYYEPSICEAENIIVSRERDATKNGHEVSSLEKSPISISSL